MTTATLDRAEMDIRNCPVQTPWGLAEFATELAPGITFYETPSHGGFFLSEERRAEMPACLREVRTFNGHVGWYEEDCDWAIVALGFPTLFPPEALKIAQDVLGRYHPEAARAHAWL